MEQHCRKRVGDNFSRHVVQSKALTTVMLIKATEAFEIQCHGRGKENHN